MSSGCNRFKFSWCSYLMFFGYKCGKDKDGNNRNGVRDEVKPFYAHKLKALLVAVLVTYTIVWYFKQQAGSEN